VRRNREGETGRDGRLQRNGDGGPRRVTTGLSDQDGTAPLVHVNPLGRGRLAYLATSSSPALTAAVIDALAGPSPVVTDPSSKRAILTRQEQQQRWILHLLSAGDCAVDIRRELAAPTKIAGQFPAGDWSAELKTTAAGVRIEVHGNAQDRLLVLQ